MDEFTLISTENSILSDKFLDFKKDNLKKIPVYIDPVKHELPNIFKSYEYPVCAWPVIINTETAKELEVLCVRIPEMIRKIPSLYFDNDVKKIADYYFNGNEMVAQFALMCHKKNIETGCRLDLTLSEKGFNILEVNIGSTIGGWQIQSFESIIRESHTMLSDTETANNFHSKNTQSNYIKFLVDQIQEQNTLNKNRIDLFIGIGELDESLKKESIIFFNSLFQKELKKRGIEGQAYNGSLSELKLNNGELVFGDVNINSIIILKTEEQETPRDVFRAFIMDKIYFPDHLGVFIYSDKRNLSLLRELAERGSFDSSDNELILKHIPWTVDVKDATVIFEKEQVSLLKLLKGNKDNFVIKDAQGKQGVDVFIGKFLSTEKWESAIKIALSEDTFVAQEFSDSMDFIAPNKNNEWTDHKLIWGAFGFGKEYGGVWVRMSEVGANNGVINSAAGAVEAIVFEAT